MCDCLIIGFNDYSLRDYLNLVKGFGTNSGAYRDLSLALVTVKGEPYRALDIFSRYYYEGRSQGRLLHNVDFLWPTITYLGSYLAKRGFSFDYINLFQFEKEKLARQLRSEPIRTLAITTTLYVIPEPIVEIIEFVRKYNQTVKIVVGGPFVGNQLLGQDEEGAQRFFSSLGADIYVDSTEGEQALANILGALKAGRGLEGIANVAYREGNSFKRGASVTETNPLEENPVDYTLFSADQLGRFVSLRTAKSCPFACSFCGFPQRAGKYKYLPVELVEQDLNRLRDLGNVDTVTFLDDTFNVPRERFREILRMMIRNRYGFKWNSFLRSDHTDDEIIQLMGEAGCEGVFLGVESGSDTMLQYMNKTARTKDYRRAIRSLKQSGIFSYASLIIGYPGETLATFHETQQFIEEVQPDSFRAQLWYADPLTPVWKRCNELGIKGSCFNWSHHTMNSSTACALVERMFLTVRNSTWLPQNGFELWSVFYLKRFGMTVAGIKQFLTRFNAVIRERLVCPGQDQSSPELLEALKASCQFDRQMTRESAGELYSAQEYADAEQFWIKKLCADSMPAPLFECSTDGSRSWRFSQFKIAEDVLEKTREKTGSTCERIILAAYAVLLSRWKVQHTVGILVVPGSGSLFPLMMSGCADLALPEVVARLDSEFAAIVPYDRYASHVAGAHKELKLREQQLRSCETAFFMGHLNKLDETSPGEIEAATSPWMSDLRLVLEVNKADGVFTGRVQYDADAIGNADMVDLIAGIQAVIQEAGDESNTAASPLDGGQGKSPADDWNSLGPDGKFHFS